MGLETRIYYSTYVILNPRHVHAGTPTNIFGGWRLTADQRLLSVYSEASYTHSHVHLSAKITVYVNKCCLLNTTIRLPETRLAESRR